LKVKIVSAQNDNCNFYFKHIDTCKQIESQQCQGPLYSQLSLQNHPNPIEVKAVTPTLSLKDF
jgi:hypothetical protein